MLQRFYYCHRFQTSITTLSARHRLATKEILLLILPCKNSLSSTRSCRTIRSSKSFSTASSRSTTQKPAHGNDSNILSLRLYRVLLRAVNDLEKTILRQNRTAQNITTTTASNTSRDDENHLRTMFLMQQPLDPSKAGGSQVLRNLSTCSDDRPASYQMVLALFYHWTIQILHEEDGPTTEYWTHFLDETARASHFRFFRFFRYTGNSIWTTPQHVRKAIRFAFENWEYTQGGKKLGSSPKFAIQAYRTIGEQKRIVLCTSSHTEHNVRVTATSRCIGRSANTNKTRFAYRIRIEHLASQEVERVVDDSSTTSGPGHEPMHVQLLGRTWYIQDTKVDEDTQEEFDYGDAVRVHAPQTGAVGQLPVLAPGQAFEYTSGCELTSPSKQGYMYGCFHMAMVPAGTPSASVGQHVDAFQSDEVFQVQVAKFPLLGNHDPLDAFME